MPAMTAIVASLGGRYREFLRLDSGDVFRRKFDEPQIRPEE